VTRYCFGFELWFWYLFLLKGIQRPTLKFESHHRLIVVSCKGRTGRMQIAGRIICNSDTYSIASSSAAKPFSIIKNNLFNFIPTLIY